jgi:hypothetical protein
MGSSGPWRRCSDRRSVLNWGAGRSLILLRISSSLVQALHTLVLWHVTIMRRWCSISVGGLLVHGRSRGGRLIRMLHWRLRVDTLAGCTRQQAAAEAAWSVEVLVLAEHRRSSLTDPSAGELHRVVG